MCTAKILPLSEIPYQNSLFHSTLKIGSHISISFTTFSIISSVELALDYITKEPFSLAFCQNLITIAEKHDVVYIMLALNTLV